MAVVVKSESDARETYQENTENSTILPSIAIDSDTLGRNSPSGEREVVEASESTPKQSQVLSRRDQQVHGSISNEELESLRSRFMDEEVVGVITMEDVLEELLQVRLTNLATICV